MEREGYIIEFFAVGNSVKVTAVDPVSGKEATIVAPKNATQDYMQKQAIKKLEYLLNKKS